MAADKITPANDAVVAVSDATKAAASCGEPPTISTFWLKNRSCTSGLTSTRLISSCNRLMIVWEVATGANIAAVAADSNSGRFPARAIVGKPGAKADGCAVLTAIAFNLPALMCIVTVPVVPNISCNWPLISGVTAPPVLL